VTPPDDAQARTADNLRAVWAHLQARPAEVAPPAASDSPAKGRFGQLGAVGVTLALLLGKLKFLAPLANVLQLKTLATMLLSIGFYAAEWGWSFAVGFVALLFVHELGHALVLRREGIAAGAPVFIPFVGAVIAMEGRPRDAYVEAKVGIGGPVLGSLGAWVVLAIGVAAHWPLFVGLGHVGIMLNLFNLVPVSPLDGGRVVGAFTKPFWVAGYSLGLAAMVLIQSPILMLMMGVGLFTLIGRWRNPVPGYDAIGRSQRLGMAGLYVGLVVALVVSLPIGQSVVREVVAR
jgi:Zn-dependent protease